MELAVIGINYNNTPIDIREKVSFSKSQKEEASCKLLKESIEEVIILSTCNRSEIYIVSEDIDYSIEKVINFYKNFFKVENIKKYIFIKKNKEVFFHIYNVATGLDSMILCEDQILGQVKDAIDFSMKFKFSKKILNKLFREAITSAKKIKRELKISETPISMVYIAIKLLKEKIGDLKEKKACIIGMGEMGRLALKHLEGEGLKEIFIANRTYNNVIDLLNEFSNITLVDYEKKYEILKEVDILITATSAPHTVIEFEKIKNIDKNITIVDLALPRDVEKSVKNLKNIKVYDVDDFKNISDDNIKKREELSKLAMEIIKVDIEEFIKWMNSLKVDFVIKELNEKCRDVKDEYLEYIIKKLNLNDKDIKLLEKMLFGALRNIIKNPILNLKNLNDDREIKECIDMINKLFNFK